MRIGFLFPKPPEPRAASIDQIRLAALAGGLRGLGHEAVVYAPVADQGELLRGVPVLPLAELGKQDRPDVLKTCYHAALPLLGAYDGPLVCRLVRVVDERLPGRDEAWRGELLASQDIAARRAAGLVFNNAENLRRWRKRHGNRQTAAIIPTGCPAELPPAGPDPYPPGLPPVLFLGSLASRRMARLLIAAAASLRGTASVHFVGRNKTGLYGGAELALTPEITAHGEAAGARLWDFIRHARLGLALAAGPDVFDNDLSKIFSYLRAGLPVLGEERLANARLFLRHGFGAEFAYADAGGLARQAATLLKRDFSAIRPDVMRWMADRHSWARRAARLADFLSRISGRQTAAG